MYWKFVKTSISIEFCDRKTYFPVLFSFFHAFWDILIMPIIIKFIEFCQQQRGKRVEPDIKHLTLTQLNAQRKHAKLMQELISPLIDKNKKTLKILDEKQRA